MPQYEVKTPEGRTFRITGDSPPTEQELEQMSAQINAQVASSEGFDPNEGVGPWEAFKIGAGRGLNTLGRGLGVVPPENPAVSANYERLQGARPFSSGSGEIIGEGAPFALPSTGVGAIPSIGARMLAATGVGALEGGLIAKGRGGSFNEILDNAGLGGVISGGFEAAFPVLSRVGGKLVSQATGKPPRGALFDSAGNPTAELSGAMSKLDMSLSDLAAETVYTLKLQKAGISPEEAARFGRFQELGIPTTRGNITQDFAQQAKEERLVNTASLSASQPLRDVQLRQSEAFQTGINDMVAALGVTEETGNLVKQALSNLESGLKSDKNELYRRMAEESPHVMAMPIIPNQIAAALPDAAQLRRVSRIPGNAVDALNDLLVEFGIDRSSDAVERFTKAGGEIIPLNLGNMEEFRAALNQLSGSPNAQSSGERAMSGIIGRLKGALDEEAEAVEKSLLDANPSQSSVLEPLREARAIVSRLKTEFSPQSIVGRVTDVRPDGVTPVIEASRVYDSVLGPSQPIEYLRRTVDSLKEAGPKGQQALHGLQAETIMRALDDALKAPSRKTSGIQTIGYPQFLRSLNRLGDEKLEVLFENNPQALSRLRMFKGAAEDIIPDARATPRGSAPVILDVMNKLGRSPGIAAFVDAVKFIVNAGSDERAVRRALESRPEIKRVYTQIQNDYPSFAAGLGIPIVSVEEDGQGAIQFLQESP